MYRHVVLFCKGEDSPHKTYHSINIKVCSGRTPRLDKVVGDTQILGDF